MHDSVTERVYGTNPEIYDAPYCGFPIISARDAMVIWEIRAELERERRRYPPFRSLASAVVEIQHRTNQLGCRLVVSCGTMDDEVRRKLLQTAAMCLRALTENG